MRVHFCREYVQDILNESLNQGGVTGSLGASAHPQNDTTKGARQLKSRHSLKGPDIPFEFACDKDSNLGNLHSNTFDGCTASLPRTCQLADRGDVSHPPLVLRNDFQS